MIDEILQMDCILEQPPILLDVGASGDIHRIWKKIAKHSICIAFDPNERDLQISNQTGSDFKNFYMINRIVSVSDENRSFYFTNYPHCSSSLKPDLNNLNHYHIASSFKIKKDVVLPSITIESALKSIGYDYIDWFKTDSQGTDLRIFSILNDEIINNVLVAEFEPGIEDAYIGEDKLWKIMEYFEERDFWCEECVVKGMSRISEDILNEDLNSLENYFIPVFQKNSSFWAEISYFNSMKNGNFSKRDFLLMSVFAFIKEQFGFVCEICNLAQEKYNDDIFQIIADYSIFKMRLRGYKKLPFYIINKILGKISNYLSL